MPSPQSDLTPWILTLLSGQPNDDNHHCVGLCSDSTGEWCDNSCSNKLHLLCEGTENQIEASLPIGTIIPWVNRPHLTSSKRKIEIPDGWQR